LLYEKVFYNLLNFIIRIIYILVGKLLLMVDVLMKNSVIWHTDWTCFLLIVQNPFLEFVVAVVVVVVVVAVADVGVEFDCIDLMPNWLHLADRIVDDTLIERQFAHLVLNPIHKEGQNLKKRPDFQF
jgi:hypothetical protein